MHGILGPMNQELNRKNQRKFLQKLLEVVVGQLNSGSLTGEETQETLVVYYATRDALHSTEL